MFFSILKTVKFSFNTCYTSSKSHDWGYKSKSYDCSYDKGHGKGHDKHHGKGHDFAIGKGHHKDHCDDDKDWGHKGWGWGKKDCDWKDDWKAKCDWDWKWDSKPKDDWKGKCDWDWKWDCKPDPKPEPDPCGCDDECPDGDPIGTEQYNASTDSTEIYVTEGYAGIIAGNDGDDSMYGGDYDDFLLGNRGDDEIYGCCGDDTLFGGEGNDTVKGGHGDDQVAGDEGTDVISGGEGNDIFYFKGKGNTDGLVNTITDFDADDDMIAFVDPANPNLFPTIRADDTSFNQDGDDVQIFVNGTLEIVVLDAFVADVIANTTYGEVA